MPKTHTLKDMHKLASSKGGKCLSDVYINAHTPCTFQCSEGHIWSTQPTTLQQGTWCPTCGTKRAAEKHRLTIEHMYEIAAERGGKCLTTKYIDSSTKLKWQCSKKHIWKATPNHIRQGAWCSECVGNKRYTLKETQQLAIKKGGKCISTEYKGSDTPLEWECSYGHIWRVTPHHVRQGHWCPYCASGRSERLCRELFEKIFSNPFPKIKPKWLNGNKKYPLELDGYCEELSLAFEYQGGQHFKYVRHFHRTKRQYNDLLERDKLKRKLCRENNVTLIEVPYTVEDDAMEDYIIERCASQGIAPKAS